MVLNNTAAPSSSDFSPDSSPPSDRDPYSSFTSDGSDSEFRHSIELSSLPGPAPLVGPLFGYTRPFLAHTIENRIRAASTLLKRPTSKDEAEALAYWSAKMQSIASWGRPVGLVAGWAQAYRTAESFRFPFIKPNPEFNKNEFYFGIKGQQARMMWNALRVGAYSTLGVWFGGIIVGSYAATIAAVGEQRDPRLKDLINAIAERVRQHGPLKPPPTNAGHGHDHTGVPEPHRTPAYPGRGGAPAPTSMSTGAGADDASPTAGGGYEDTTYADLATLSKSQDTSIMSDQQMHGLQSQRQATVDKMRANRPGSLDFPSQSPPATTTRSSSSSSERSGTFFDDDPRDHPDYNYSSSYNDDDDMSPTAPAHRQVSETSTHPGESAWDRIRRETGSAPSGPGPRRGAWSTASSSPSSSSSSFPSSRSSPESQSESTPDFYPDTNPTTTSTSGASAPSAGNTWAQRRLASLSGSTSGGTAGSPSGSGDSFTFSATDEDRQLAQNEAQRDFDQRVERERQGGDFAASESSASTSGRGWRRW